MYVNVNAFTCSPYTHLKSKHFLVYIRKPVLPSRSRPDSPYKHPDSHSVGSLQLLHSICKTITTDVDEPENDQNRSKAYCTVFLLDIRVFPVMNSIRVMSIFNQTHW